MNEPFYVKRFNEDIDILIKEGHLGHFETRSEELKLLELAQLIVKIDLSKESCIEHRLRQRLLSKLEKQKGTDTTVVKTEEDELEESELDNVAGGLDLQRSNIGPDFNLSKKPTVDE